MRHAIDSRIRRLDAFFQRAKQPSLTDEIRSDLAKLGAVLVCGFVERSVEIVVLDRLSSMAHPRVNSFIRSHFRRGTNYDREAICQLFERFDLEWGRRLRETLASRDSITASLESAYTLRNSIAHGGDQYRGLKGVEDLYIDAKQLVEAMILATRDRPG